ncbi:hypothetical protein CFP56_021186 [Quercus suber]|uniref:Uncharacterized protein n=1 Tax=Quercus suber TaxID=58331 RepID=A0AAW0KFV1_QUESU
MILIVIYKVQVLSCISCTNTECPNWITFGRHRPLVATSCSCLCGAQTCCQCLKVGASSVHASNSDMPVIADLNITSVSEIQDKPEKPIKKKKKIHQKNSTNVTLQKLSQMLWTVAGLPMDVANRSGFGFEFDLTVAHGFNLGSSSLVYPSVNDDFDFNPYPQLKKMKTS